MNRLPWPTVERLVAAGILHESEVCAGRCYRVADGEVYGLTEPGGRGEPLTAYGEDTRAVDVFLAGVT